MDEYIDREAVIKAIEFNKGVGCSDRCVQGIKYIPAADVKPVTRAKWKRELWFITCSNCGCTMADKDDEGEWLPTNFCPNCGADMREGE